MRIGVAQLNSTVGDLQVNLALGLDAYEQLVGQGSDLVVFPELFISGYPPRDLLMKEKFLQDSLEVLQDFARQTGPTPALIGFPEPAPENPSKIFNSAAWCEHSKIDQVFRKSQKSTKNQCFGESSKKVQQKITNLKYSILNFETTLDLP